MLIWHIQTWTYLRLAKPLTAHTSYPGDWDITLLPSDKRYGSMHRYLIKEKECLLSTGNREQIKVVPFHITNLLTGPSTLTLKTIWLCGSKNVTPCPTLSHKFALLLLDRYKDIFIKFFMAVWASTTLLSYDTCQSESKNETDNVTDAPSQLH